MLPFLLPNHSLGANGTLRHVSKALKRASRIRCIDQRVAIPSSSRNFASEADEDGEDESSEIQTPVERSGEHLRWLRSHEGQSFRRPREDGPNWLGGSVPFPLNPSFKPPPPITDKLRTEIFNKHLEKGKTEEELSSEYKLGINRIRAILRLKKLEQLWVMNKIRHHQFQSRMERYLGAQIDPYDKSRQAARDSANRIDIDVHTHSIGESTRLQRVYFEMVPEGQNPPLAQHLDLAQAVTEEAEAALAGSKKALSLRHLTVAPVTLLKENGTPYDSATKYKWFYPAKAGRTPYTFIDAGDRYRRGGTRTKKAKTDEEGKKVAPAVPGQSRRLQLALEAVKLKAEQRMISEEIATREAMRLKRQQIAKHELASARQKVPTVEIQL
ncbi:SubName: Full=Uncharacterized protein {ECO:0000313/EMBL:CCA68742.1} [Serendipita indica DSM 11827]|nr:SubName: Full=Uncharacterized protein {ECO:0000313/EMBL:CCA68742.1} [Serendipita indica DSM 11827]